MRKILDLNKDELEEMFEIRDYFYSKAKKTYRESDFKHFHLNCYCRRTWDEDGYVIRLHEIKCHGGTPTWNHFRIQVLKVINYIVRNWVFSRNATRYVDDCDPDKGEIWVADLNTIIKAVSEFNESLAVKCILDLSFMD